MSSYNPPQENLPIFDAGVFLNASDVLTVDYLATLFVRYPIAQTGLLTLSSTLTEGTAVFNSPMTLNSPPALGDNSSLVPTTAWVNTAIGGGSSLLTSNNTWTGTNTFQNDLFQTSSETNNITQSTIDTNSNQNTLRKTYIYGDLQLKRPTSDNGGAFWLWDVSSGSSGYFTQFYQTGTNMVYYNKCNSGPHTFWNLTSGGAQLNTLTLSDTNMTIATTNAPTCAASSTIATSDSSNKIPSTAWVQSVVSGGAPKQVFTYQFFNSATTTPSSTSVQMVVPYVNVANFSWLVRLEVNYTLYANNNTNSAVDPKVLSQIVGGAGQVNVNPNTQAIIDLTFASVARTTVAQSTSSAITTLQSYYPTNQTGPYTYTPFAISTTNNSPSSGLSTVTITIGFPAVPYATAPTYQGNIVTAAVSLRILSSMTSATSTPTSTTSSSGIAYFV